MEISRQRLCVLIPGHWSAWFGGAEYQAKCLLDVLVPLRRFEIHYVARHVATDFQPTGYQLARVGDPTVTPRLGYIADAPMIYRALRRLRPHVIYQRVGCAYTAIAAQYARRHGTRLVWHVAHDTDVSPETLGSGNPLRLLIEKRSIEFGLRNATHVICQTQDQATLLRRHYNRTADAVIPNFQPKPIEDSEKATQKLVVWVANFKRWKQPDAFVRLAANLQGVAGARFIMVGARATGSRDRIWSDNLMRSIQQVPNLTYLGPQTQEEVNRLLARSHVFVNTSLHEGFPNTFIQAWMRRVPVVSLHVNPDNVFDNVSIGIHAESEDRLADSVRTLLTDESMLADYSSAAYTYAMDRHSERNGHLIARMLEFGGG